MKTQTRSLSRPPRLLTSLLLALANVMLRPKLQANAADVVDVEAGLLATMKVR